MISNPKTRRRTSYQSKEDETTGLSSEQIWTQLNELLGLSARPFIENTYFGADLLISLLSASIDRRRKVSTLSAEDCRAVVFYALLFEPVDKVYDVLKNIGIERNLIFDPITDCISENSVSGGLLPQSPFSEEALIRHMETSIEPYIDFRGKVAKRYIKLADSMGKKNAWLKHKNGLISDASEHINNYVLAVLRAIDKFYPHKGTLASYVDSWMSNAAGSSLTVYMNEAFSIPRATRKKLADGDTDTTKNLALPIEKALQLEDDSTSEVEKDIDYQAYVQILESVYTKKECWLAWLEMEFPILLTSKDFKSLLTNKNVVVGKNLRKQVFDIDKIFDLPDNVNFLKAIKTVKSKEFL